MSAVPDVSGRDIHPTSYDEASYEDRLAMATKAMSGAAIEHPTPMIYVAGPISKGVRDSVRLACKAQVILFEWGAVPFIPQLSHFADFIEPQDVDFWLGLDATLLRDHVDALVRLPGESAGADAEVNFMRALDRPVFFWDRDAIRISNWIRDYAEGKTTL